MALETQNSLHEKDPIKDYTYSEIERVSTGIESLDVLIQGGVVKGTVTLIIGAPSSGKSLMTQAFLTEALKHDGSSIYLDFEKPPVFVKRQIIQFFGDVSEPEKNNTFLLVDGYSGSISSCYVPNEYHISNPENVNEIFKVLYDSTHALHEKSNNKVAIDSFTPLILGAGTKSALRFLQRGVAYLRGTGITSYVVLTSFAHKPEVENIFKSLADNVIELKLVEDRNLLLRYMRISKMALTSHRTDWIPYEIIQSKGIVVDTSVISEFEQLKHNLEFGPETGLLLSGENSVIFKEKYLDTLIDAISKEVGDAYANKILYTSAEHVGYEFARKVMETKKVSEDAVLDMFLRYHTLMGFGFFKVQKLNLSVPELIVIADWTIFSKNKKKSSAPIDHYIRGAIAGIIKYLTDKPVYCRETKCIAAGHTHCKFVV